MSVEDSLEWTAVPVSQKNKRLTHQANELPTFHGHGLFIHPYKPKSSGKNEAKQCSEIN